jgi:hypothetical protein
MAMRKLMLVLIACIIVCSAQAQDEIKKLLTRKQRKYQYEEVNFEDLMRRYFLKGQPNEVEGIYSVSCVITKRSKVFLSKREKIRVVERQDNYARVALIKDWPGSKRDFIEISLSYHDAKKYPIMGTMNAISEGNGLIYNHIEPDGKPISFSMIIESSELIEGEFSKIERRKTVTYRLSYLKIFPKSQDIVFNR